MRKPAARDPRSGFALLLVYAMAATLAIMLYMALPRVAFEAQRDREQLLIDRGEQYSRAINLYVRKFNKYPADFDALENTQNLRFLRHQYVDPFTGKQEWRLIHVGPGGVFTDSLVYGQKKPGDTTKPEQQSFITEMQQIGGNPVDPNAAAVSPGLRQRPSDQPGAPGMPGASTSSPYPPQIDANGQPILNQPATPGVPGVSNSNPFPPQIDANGQPIQPATQAGAGMPGSPQSPINLPPGVQVPPGAQLPPGIQTASTGQQPVQQPNGPPGSAASLINQLLTTPRPGGLNGIGGQPTTATAGGLNPIPSNSPPGTPLQPMAGQTIGGGIAGIASKVVEEGIKHYNDRTKYNEWEFVYDISKDPARNGATAVPQSAPPPGTPIGSPTSNVPGPNTPTTTTTAPPVPPAQTMGLPTAPSQ